MNVFQHPGGVGRLALAKGDKHGVVLIVEPNFDGRTAPASLAALKTAAEEWAAENNVEHVEIVQGNSDSRR